MSRDDIVYITSTDDALEHSHNIISAYDVNNTFYLYMNVKATHLYISQIVLQR